MSVTSDTGRTIAGTELLLREIVDKRTRAENRETNRQDGAQLADTQSVNRHTHAGTEREGQNRHTDRKQTHTSTPTHASAGCSVSSAWSNRDWRNALANMARRSRAFMSGAPPHTKLSRSRTPDSFAEEGKGAGQKSRVMRVPGSQSATGQRSEYAVGGPERRSVCESKRKHVERERRGKKGEKASKCKRERKGAIS